VRFNSSWAQDCKKNSRRDFQMPNFYCSVSLSDAVERQTISSRLLPETVVQKKCFSTWARFLKQWSWRSPKHDLS
jgi:hypothetical protein